MRPDIYAELPSCLRRRMILRRIVTGALAGTLLGAGLAFVLDILARHPVVFFFSGHGVASVSPIITQAVLIVGGFCGCGVGALAVSMSVIVESLHHHALVVNNCTSHLQAELHERSNEAPPALVSFEASRVPEPPGLALLSPTLAGRSTPVLEKEKP